MGNKGSTTANSSAWKECRMFDATVAAAFNWIYPTVAASPGPVLEFTANVSDVLHGYTNGLYCYLSYANCIANPD